LKFNKLFIFILVLVALSSFVSATGEITESYEVNDFSYWLGSSGGDRMEHERQFQASTTYTINKVSFWASDNPVGTGNIVVQLRATNCDGSLLASNTTPLSYWVNGNIINLTLDTPVDLTEGELYAWCFENTLSGSNYITIKAKGQDSYGYSARRNYNEAGYASIAPNDRGVNFRNYNSSTTLIIAGSIILLSPVNDTISNNQTITFNYNVTGNATNCSLYINNILNVTNYNISNETAENVAFFDNGVYNWNISCDFGTENVTSDAWTFEVDTVEPYINVGALQNKAVVGTLSGQINISDDNLYGINISDAVSGTIFYNISYSGTELLYNLSLNTSAYPQGWNILTVESSDGHTTAKIKDYKTSSSLFNNDVFFEFDNGYVKINPEGITDDLTTTKKKDRYNFKLKRSKKKKNKDIVFYIESNHEVDYLKDSDYRAHFVVPKLNKWIDFEIEGKTGKEEYKVEKLNDKYYKIVISNVKDIEDITFNSIGD